MASASEILARINGISETKKITDAMYMVSSAKMRKALRELEKTTPYFNALIDTVDTLWHRLPPNDNRYFQFSEEDDKPHKSRGILLITSDKGLAGSYNQTAIRECEAYMQRHPNTTLFIIGRYGRRYFSNKKINFVKDFLYSSDRPQLLDARRISRELLQYYDDGKLDEINVVYTDYNQNKTECKMIHILPLQRTNFDQSQLTVDVVEREFFPSPDEVLRGMIPSYVMGFIYGCLVESYCSEQQARMLAMKGAGDNAEKILKELKLQYNEVRQAAITEEMIEISAGAMAQRHKRKAAARLAKGDTSNE